MKIVLKIILATVGTIIAISSIVALVLALKKGGAGDQGISYKPIVFKPDAVFVEYADSQIENLTELLDALQVRGEQHRHGQITPTETFKQFIGKLIRQPIDENNLERPEMCATGLFYPGEVDPDTELPPKEYMVPLKDVQIQATLEGALATIDFDMTYTNPSDNPIECTYEFPLEAETLLSKLTIYVDDKVIEALVLEKEEAELTYKEVIAGGDLGVFLERQREGQKFMSLKVGNLLPGKEIRVSAQLIQPLQVVNSAYSFILPVAFYPNYRKLGADSDRYPYNFSYSVLIKSENGINMISKPSNSIIEYEKTGRFATIFCAEPDREIQVFYRTNDMENPQLLFANNDAYYYEVASTMSFVPTFINTDKRLQRFEILEDEEPYQSIQLDPQLLHFIFVLDRSGSMWGNRMEKAKEALILFLRSLPEGCKFSVINYGSQQEVLYANDNKVIDYNEENVMDAISQIEKYMADLGGTNIATPMEMAIQLDVDSNLKKRVILLTDGMHNEGPPASRVIELAADEATVVHTFGLSNAADADLLQKTAEAGRGTFSLIEDYESGSVLNGKVIAALKKCIEPALEHCTISWGSETKQLDTVFRNQLVYETKLTSQAEFESFSVRFNCLNDPTTGRPVNFEFTSEDFTQVEAEQSLGMFKLCAYNLPQLTTAQAVKYQVLTDTTAMIGVVKQDKGIGKLKEIDTIQFGKGTVKTPEPEYPEWDPTADYDLTYVPESMPMKKESSADSPPAATFENLIKEFHISGYLKDSAEDILKLFFEDDDMIDDAVKSELTNVSDEDRAYLTLTAIYVLEEKFEDRDSEFDLIVQKAKKYLQSVGVSNPKALLKKFSLKFKN